MNSNLDTPLGNIEVFLNDKPIEYVYSIEKEVVDGKNVDVFVIKIDLLNYEINDEICCCIPNKKLEYNDGDERCVLLSIEADDIILGICGYEPQYHEAEREEHCYELDEATYGFLYKIYRNPKDYINKNKISYTIELKVCWLDKKEFKDYDTSLFMILC